MICFPVAILVICFVTSVGWSSSPPKHWRPTVGQTSRRLCTRLIPWRRSISIHDSDCDRAARDPPAGPAGEARRVQQHRVAFMEIEQRVWGLLDTGMETPEFEARGQYRSPWCARDQVRASGCVETAALLLSPMAACCWSVSRMKLPTSRRQ
jgi:hypothetical protein